jgi:hypothetical protein
MVQFNQKHLKWLRTLSTEEAWKQIVKEATVGTRSLLKSFFRAFHPVPDFKNRMDVRRWLDWVLAKIDLDT